MTVNGGDMVSYHGVLAQQLGAQVFGEGRT